MDGSASKLLALILRSRKPIFTSAEDVAQTATALVELAPYFGIHETREALFPLRKFARHNPALLQDVLKEVPVDAASASHGKRLAMLTRVIPTNSQTDTITALWGYVVATAARALEQKAWSPSTLKVILAHTRRHARYDAVFVEAAAAYVAATLPTATVAELPALVSVITSLPELATHPSKLLDAAAERCAAVGEVLSPGAIGYICGQLNRTLSLNANAAVVFQEEAGRCAEQGDTFTAVQLLSFVARHKADQISTDAVIWMIERISGEELDVAAVETLCGALVHLPLSTRTALRQEMLEFVDYVAAQAAQLLTQVPVHEGGLLGSADVEAVQIYVSHVLGLSALLNDFTDATTWPAELLAAANACAEAVAPLQENLLSAESSPFGLMVRLLEAPTDTCRQRGLAMLREAASQCMPFPARQTFRFLLVMGDHQMRDVATARYLRDQFAKTAADVPPVQLSVALRCLGIATSSGGDSEGSTLNAEEEEAELEKERLDLFLQFCVETTRRHLAQGAPLHCVLSTTDQLYRLGCRDVTFLADVAAYIEMKREVAVVEAESAEAATAVCAALGEVLLEQHPEVHEFLLDVEERGVKGEAALLPSQWLVAHDPASTFEPLTPQQQESWDIIEEMVRTRSDDTATLTALAEKYIALLPYARPDDHKYFFGVFEEKVLKEDKLLKQCLDAIVVSGKLSRLSAVTIAGMLDSLAAIRFQYFPSVKRFMASITQEQWQSMEAVPLVQILVGMEKLALRTPEVLRQIGSRLNALLRFLSPLDTARAIHALQALGHNDAALLKKLTAHAAASARRFDEASMNILFSTPSIHRLLSTPQVAQPLLMQASVKIYSSHRREKIAKWVRRSGLPRDLIEGCTARLQVLGSDSAKQDVPLRLT